MRRRAVTGAARHLVSALVALAFVLPIWWVIVMSLRPAGLPPSPTLEWWPGAPAWGNYARLFELVPLGRQSLNSLVVGLLAVPLTLLTASWAGFALASVAAPLRRRLVVGALLLMLVPVTALWLTRFVIFRQLGLINSPLALVLPALSGTNPFYILLFYWTFRRIPAEIFEAARLEGAGPLSLWARMALPLSRPTMVTVSVLTFSFYWSDLISPLLYLKSEDRYTVPVGLSALQQMDVMDGPVVMAGAVVALLPIVVMFLVAHRFFWPDELLLKPVGMAPGDPAKGTPGYNS